MKADTPIALADLTKMTPEEHEALVVQIRDRRLKPVRVYEELSLMKAEARKEMLEKQWAKQLEMFEKELVRADRAIQKIEMRQVKLRAMKMEIEEM
jgi:hypothetical protein